MSNHKSFTLIELLVVIAIIGVLAAIVITSMSGAITRSKIARLQIFSDSIRAQLSDSLVSYWSFNEGSGVTVYDQWEGNNGTLVGDPTWKSGGDCVSGKCLEFDGTGDYIALASFPSSGYEMTLSLWIKPLDTLSNSMQIFYAPCESGLTLRLYRNSPWSLDSLAWLMYYQNTSLETSHIGLHHTYSIDAWQYTLFTFNSIGYYEMYVDGIRFASGQSPNFVKWWIPNSYLRIGGFDGIAGLIDEVRIYNSAASITQVQSQYLAGLDKLLSNGAISKTEYNQRIKELSKEIVIE